jgi:hypothetical protein
MKGEYVLAPLDHVRDPERLGQLAVDVLKEESGRYFSPKLNFCLSLLTPVIVAAATFRIWAWYATAGAALVSGVVTFLTLVLAQFRRWHRERPLLFEFHKEIQRVWREKSFVTESQITLCWIVVQEYGTEAQRNELEVVYPMGSFPIEEAKRRGGI